MAGETLSRFARRVGSRGDGAVTGEVQSPGKGRRPWLLTVLPGFFVLPFLSGLFTGDPLSMLGAVAAAGLFRLAAVRMRRGFALEADYAARTIAAPPPPMKLQSAGLVGLGLLILALCGGQGIGMALAYGLFAALATVLTYGSDPLRAKGPAGVLEGRMPHAEIVAALGEARSKVAAIRADAAAIAGLELKRHLGLIAGRADAILDQLEREPRDMHKARRFLVTYLDGTRDVVARYRQQQADVAGTPLGRSFREVLGTVERAFQEQEEVLKHRDTLDLEVEIDALRTQMEREGVSR